MPPSPEAQRRASRAIAAAIDETDRVVQLAGVNGLSLRRTMERDLRAADRQLSLLLQAEWARFSGPSGRATEAHLLAARAQVRIVLDRLLGKLQGVLNQGTNYSTLAGVAQSHKLIADLEENFEGIATPVALTEVLTMTNRTGYKGSLLAIQKTSLDRYGVAMTEEIMGTLRMGMAAGLTVSEMTELLTGHGGPRGKVSLRARVVNGRVVRVQTEDIPEGLFRRKRWWARRIVRTEVSRAYNASKEVAHAQYAQVGVRVDKKIIATFDKRTADDSRYVHGQIRKPGEYFMDGKGRQYLYPPARPNDRETIIPWKTAWPEDEQTRPLGDRDKFAPEPLMARPRPSHGKPFKLGAPPAPAAPRARTVSSGPIAGIEPPPVVKVPPVNVKVGPRTPDGVPITLEPSKPQ